MLSSELFEIVPFDPSHQEGACALAEDILCVERHLQPDIAGEKDLQDIARSYAAPDGRFLVAIAGGEVVGSAGILRLSERDCELKRLYVLPDYRRKGIASSLVGTLLPFVRERGYRRMLLEIGPEMADTIHRYTRYGFVPLSENDNLPRPGSFLAIKF
jgi:GNAT superfamily N-acetyltransferase